jgi:hypothetical protein
LPFTACTVGYLGMVIYCSAWAGDVWPRFHPGREWVAMFKLQIYNSWLYHQMWLNKTWVKLCDVKSGKKQAGDRFQVWCIIKNQNSFCPFTLRFRAVTFYTAVQSSEDCLILSCHLISCCKILRTYNSVFQSMHSLHFITLMNVSSICCYVICYWWSFVSCVSCKAVGPWSWLHTVV